MRKYNIMSLEIVLSNIKDTLQNIAPIVSTILVILAGFVYGFSQLQPAEQRGRYIHISLGLLIGGIIIAAVSVGAEMITSVAQQTLQS
jgi:predicted membrane protein